MPPPHPTPPLTHKARALLGAGASGCRLAPTMASTAGPHQPGRGSCPTTRSRVTWPLPGSFNIAFGELSILFGGLLAALAWHLAKGWELRPLSFYALFAGLAALIVGTQFFRLELSQTPRLAGTGFLLAGLGGLGAYPTLRWSKNRSLRYTGASVLLVSSAIWGWFALSAFWAHLARFMDR